MRPAQKAPENPRSGCTLRRRPSRFNEAGAKSAGKQRALGHMGRRMRGFNEAGAKSAGKHAIATFRACKQYPASMRPAQKAPENIRPAAGIIARAGQLQ